MNQLKVSLQQTILALAARDGSRRRIARELGINRETVGKYLRGQTSDEPAKPAIPPTGSDTIGDSKPAIVPAGSAAGRKSQCEPWRQQIEAAVAQGLSAQRIYQDLVTAKFNV
jgi:predicted transcriptional regulator